MANEDLIHTSVAELSALLGERKLSPVELTQSYLNRIEALDDRLHAFITIDAEGALAAAKIAESAIANGKRIGPLHGIPMAVKDQMDARGLPTTGGSSILNDIATADSTVVGRLREAGVVLLGKLNLSEFALGGSIKHPYGVPRNPWDTDRQPGQSSSGSGIAVAASMCAAAIGEDTSGSIRGPASWCGITGLRPTWGRVSRHGILPMSWSMDQAGPMTKTVEDCATVFAAIAGYDPHDAYTSHQPVPAYKSLESLKGLKIGVIRESMGDGMVDSEVQQQCEEAVVAMRQAGAEVIEVSIPLFPQGGLISNGVADADAAYVHRERLAAHAAEYDFATRRRLLAASLMPAHLYQKAQRFRVIMRRQVMAALESADVLVTPSQSQPAPLIATDTGLYSKDAVMRQFFGIRAHRGPFNLAAVPAMSIPCGFTDAGLPVGLQLVGRPFDESTLFQVGGAYQARTDWHTRRPPL
jgi:aspartyl-tRNA(Asn)/glutamyl-tRNA(Gln) amidotransferase subunit A